MSADAKRPSEVLARQLKVWRGKRGLSARALAERIAQLGGGLDRVAIASIEVGKRGVSLDEALLLAAALDVPPPLLMVPLGTDDRVEITSKSRIHPHAALEWIAAEQPLMSTERYVLGVTEWAQAARPIDLHRALRASQTQLQEATTALRAAEYVGDQERLIEARQEHAKALKSLADVIRTMLDEGIRPPAFGAETVDQMHTVGIDVEGFRVLPEDD